MLEVEFVLVSEGPSEEPLVPHLEKLCVESGASEATGFWLDLRAVPNPPGKGVDDQLGYLVGRVDFDYDIVFIHRDADARSDEHVRTVIRRGVESVRLQTPVVPVVPVQALEAWLLIDPATVRRVVGNPRGTSDLRLPKASRVEAVHDPKAVLREALDVASEETGARRRAMLKRFGKMRRALLEQLSHDGPIRDVPSWNRLVADVRECLSQLRDRHGD